MADKTGRYNISIRVNEEEHDLIEAKRVLSGLSLRKFILRCVTEKRIIVKPGAPLVAGQIGRIGNNLNQLARHVNSGFVPENCARILEEIRDEIAEIRRAWQSSKR